MAVLLTWVTKLQSHRVGEQWCDRIKEASSVLSMKVFIQGQKYKGIGTDALVMLVDTAQ